VTDREPARELVYEPRFNADLLHWIKTQPRLAVRVLELVEAVRRHPFTGAGKPEPLKGLGPDTWSRRINDEHRLVYVVGHDRVTFVQARYHYER
jgi:toxin YoeB